MWLIYKHTNKTNNKVYIGQTKKSPAVRWRNGHGYRGNTRFSMAINKYGWENFIHEIIEDNIPTQKEANEREIYWINYYHSYNFDFGYNMSPGGYLQTEESREKQKNSFKKQHRNKLNFIWCYELMKIFPNPTIALEWFLSSGYCKKGQKNPIVRVIDKEEHTCFGFHFCSMANFLSFHPKSKTEINSLKGHRKKVVCIETGDVFESISECSRLLNIAVQHICRACKNHTKTHGRYFCYLEDYDSCWQKHEKARVNANKKSIYCIELDKQWDSYAACGKELGVSSSAFSRLIKNQDPLCIHSTINGMHFCKLDQISIFKIVETSNTRSDSRQLCCIETNEIFDSITQAEKKYNCKNILKCCKNWRFTSGGYHWCFLEDRQNYQHINQVERSHRNGLAKRVIRLDDGKIFPTASAAARSINRNVSTLVEAIKQHTRCAGCFWEYYFDK